ncbi:type III-A CRISPR-associated RAMP protein Csm5 [Catalinimonas sp. 4WD22]|uniref:type III-A CRISPR-associated RAMP protein Csm5 n=1 Tax=Catalinimonas locisalis TaxID=3133978 RepID=UPI003100EF65
MLDQLSHNYYLKAEVLTPLHIGGGKENNWQKDLDFFYEKGKFRLINRDKLFGRLNEQEINNLSSLMASGKLADFRNYLLKDKNRLNEVTIREFDLSQAPEQNEIVAMIRDGQGQIYMPGSSLKGGFRSILFKKFKQTSRDNPTEVFGRIGEDWMRLLRVTDAYFDKSEIIHTKTFNLQGYQTSLSAGWKHGGNRTDEKFRETGFVTSFEVIPPGSKSLLRVSLADGVYKQLSIKQQANKKTAEFIKQGRLAPFFQIINEHTREFLAKEISFFERFAGDRTADIVENLKSLLKQIPSNDNTCILRLGLGSGYHSITGDWQHDDFTRTGVWENGPRRRQGNFKVKSRKLGLVIENDQIDILPMGFIKLSIMSDTEYLKEMSRIAEEKEDTIHEEQIRLQKDKQKAEEERIRLAKEEEDRSKAEEEATAAKQRSLEEKLANMPKPLEGDLKSDDVIEAEIYTIKSNFAMAKYSPEPGKYSGQTELQVGKKARKLVPNFDSKFKVGALVKARVELLKKKNKVTLHFIDFVEG